MSERANFASLLRQLASDVARVERERVCCGEVTLQQFETLRLIHRERGLTTSVLAERLGIDLSTASRNLTVLEREGYVRRARDTEDARRVVHRLTPAGIRCVETLCCEEDTVFAAAWAAIPSIHRRTVIAALEAVRGALAEPAGRAGAVCCPPEESASCKPRGESK